MLVSARGMTEKKCFIVGVMLVTVRVTAEQACYGEPGLQLGLVSKIHSFVIP